MKDSKKLIQDFRTAVYTMQRTNNTEYFSTFCENYDMYFSPAIVDQRDPFMRGVFNDVTRQLAEQGIVADDIRVNELSAEELDVIVKKIGEAFDYARNHENEHGEIVGYDAEIDKLAKDMFAKIHDPNKPIILVDSMSQHDVRVFMDMTRRLPAEVPYMMNIPVTPLAKPVEDQEFLNVQGRLVDSVRSLDNYSFNSLSIMFTTDSATFVHCGNPAVAQKLVEMEQEYLRERNMPLPELGGRAGTLAAIAGYRHIEQPAIMESYINAGGHTRADALGAVSDIFKEFNDELPIYAYASSQETCFKSMDGGLHNYPILMMPGDQIVVTRANSDLFASIGDVQGDLSGPQTVVSVHSNEHGSVVITDQAVFAVGGIGENIIDQVHALQYAKTLDTRDDYGDGPTGFEDGPGNR